MSRTNDTERFLLFDYYEYSRIRKVFLYIIMCMCVCVCVCGWKGEHVGELTVNVVAFNKTLQLDLVLNKCAFFTAICHF